MAAQPANYFKTLAGVPVLYDRLKPEHYGKTGIPYQFHCTAATQATLEGLITELFARTVPHFGPVSAILSAGAWVKKSGQHGLGKAFDLDAILWQRIHFVALQQPQHKELYLAVEALCHKHFGVVLDYHYDADHRDHLHVDISRAVKFRETKSVTAFLQEAMNTFYGQHLIVDGEYGDDTETALDEVLALLGIANVNTAARWKQFLDVVCEEAISRVAAALDAETNAGIRSALADGHNAELDLVLDTDENPQLARAGEAHGATVGVHLLALRPNTGRIDLNYKPFPTWTISPKTVGGQQRWYLDFETTEEYYLGYKFVFGTSGYLGLARTGASEPNIAYDHLVYRASFGDWASFVYPTGRCESEAKFLVINAWDAAAMTLGFFQMAAHTGEHLANLFRELINALPDEADQFFPELKLGKQIGDPDKMRLFAVNGADKLDLDQAAAPADGLPASSWYRGRFMDFFNPHRGKLNQEEVVTAARWVAWLMTSSPARDVCVRNAVDGAKKAVKRVHKYVGDQNHPKYPNGLDGVAMDLVAAAMDVKHHGRKNHDIGQSNDQSIFSALIAADPWAAFAKIDTGWREDRSKRSVAEIRAMGPWFDGKIYDATTESFHSA